MARSELRTLSWVLVLVVIALTCTSVSAGRNDKVPLLSPENLQDIVLDNGKWVVRFFRANCAICNILQSHWDNLVDHALKHDPEFKLAEVNLDDDVNNELAIRLRLVSIPELVIFSGRQFWVYPGPTHDINTYLEYIHEGYLKEGTEEYPNEPAYFNPSEAPLKHSDVIELTAADFHKQTSKGVWLINVYGPLCSICKRLEPRWESLASRVANNGGAFHVAKLNAQANIAIAQEYMAFPWPYILLIRNGQSYRLTEPREFRSVEEYEEYATKGYAREHDEQKLQKEQEMKDKQAEIDMMHDEL